MSSIKIVAPRSLVVMGLNSGTSADGLDMAVLRIQSRRNKKSVTFLKGSTRRYPKKIRAAILRAAASPAQALEELIALDNVLGRFFGQCARDLLSSLGKDSIVIDAVASHGQTIRHLPRPTRIAGRRGHGSLQIGSPEQIAAMTGTVVVSEFRQSDIALGGEGAPITTAAMHQIYSDTRESRLILNLGGIANFFFFPAGGSIESSLAADCGPGNSLIDLLSEELCDRPFDRDGRLAAQGKPATRLLADLKRHTFFKGKRKSTGREEFGLTVAQKLVDRGKRMRLSTEDILATAVELTVWSITRSLRILADGNLKPEKLYLTGGGAHNTFMKRRLEEELPWVRMESINQLGVPSDLVEAAAFAVMGSATLNGKAQPTRFGPSANGCSLPVSGRITLPPVAAKPTKP